MLRELRQLYREQLDTSERGLVRSALGARRHSGGGTANLVPGRVGLLLAALLLLLILIGTAPAFAHCDTLGGPVIADAQKALQQKDVTPVLKWLKPEYEAEVRTLFAKTVRVRAQGADAAELADRHFFETVVRLHRAGEGEPYTGLKQEGADELIVATDAAIASGNNAAVVDKVRDELTRGLRERFARVIEARRDADKSVEAGRRYVAAYVELLHYVEQLHRSGEAHPEEAGR